MDPVDTGSFMQRQFAGASAEVGAALVDAGRTAHTRSLNAKSGSRLRTNHAYGHTFWLALPEEVVRGLAKVLNDATVYSPRGSQYELIAWRESVILPIKTVESTSRAGLMRARISDLRTKLTSVNMPSEPEPTLLDELNEPARNDAQQKALETVRSARTRLGNVADTIIVVAYACSPRSGLHRVEAGIATFDAEGHILFSDSESLSMTATVSSAPVRPTVATSFRDAPRPSPILGLVPTATAAVEDSRPPVGKPKAE